MSVPLLGGNFGSYSKRPSGVEIDPSQHPGSGKALPIHNLKQRAGMSSLYLNTTHSSVDLSEHAIGELPDREDALSPLEQGTRHHNKSPLGKGFMQLNMTSP